MTPAAPVVPKHVTTGTRSARATNPAWPAATARLTWCSTRATALNLCPALVGDQSDSGDPAAYTIQAGERLETPKNPHRGTGSFMSLQYATLPALGEQERINVGPELLCTVQATVRGPRLLPLGESELLVFSLG